MTNNRLFHVTYTVPSKSMTPKNYGKMTEDFDKALDKAVRAARKHPNAVIELWDIDLELGQMVCASMLQYDSELDIVIRPLG